MSQAIKKGLTFGSKGFSDGGTLAAPKVGLCEWLTNDKGSGKSLACASLLIYARRLLLCCAMFPLLKARLCRPENGFLISAVNTALDKFWTLLFATTAAVTVGPTAPATSAAAEILACISCWYCLADSYLDLPASINTPLKTKHGLTTPAELEPVFTKFIGLLMQIGRETAQVARAFSGTNRSSSNTESPTSQGSNI